MIGDKLTIQQRKPSNFESCHEPGQSDFGRIPFPRKHALTTKCSADCNPVKPSNQTFFSGFFIELPAFDTMGVTCMMQSHKCLLYLSVDPGFLSTSGCLGTNPDYIFKSSIDTDTKLVSANCLAQRSRKIKCLQRYNRPHLWFHPKRLRVVPTVRHRKNPGRIGFQKKIEINWHWAHNSCMPRHRTEAFDRSARQGRQPAQLA